MARKPDFSNFSNPSARSVSAGFVSAPAARRGLGDEDDPADDPARNPLGLQARPKASRRTRRVSLLVSPELYDGAKAVADELGISFNELVSQLLKKAVQASR
ncbi:MAG: hypothetical protein HUK26_05520 [Duodenibacillus sp.]|nr:hypothetical protein [Duodenibacillus sp.]